jgi:hypothetical protein
MGLCIYYSGQIREKQLLPRLIEEVEELCGIMDWPHQRISLEGAEGIIFTPPGCETVYLTFNRDGQLVSLVNMACGIQPATEIWVKTQFAGIEVHRALIHLFRRLRDEYFAAFEMMDEAYYWETGDEETLRQRFLEYDSLMNAVCGALEGFTKREGEGSEKTSERLERYLKERFPRGEFSFLPLKKQN